ADVVGRANHDRLHHIALLDAPARNGFLDRHHDHVAHGSVFPLRPAQHLDAHDTTCAGIIRHVEVCLHLNHDWPPSSLLTGWAISPPPVCPKFVLTQAWSVSTTIQRLSLEIGADSWMDT